MSFLRSTCAILAILTYSICGAQDSNATFSSSTEYDSQRFEEVNIYEAGSAVFVLQSKQVQVHTYDRATTTYGQLSIFNKETLELLGSRTELEDWEYQDEEAILCGQGTVGDTMVLFYVSEVGDGSAVLVSRPFADNGSALRPQILDSTYIKSDLALKDHYRITDVGSDVFVTLDGISKRVVNIEGQRAKLNFLRFSSLQKEPELIGISLVSQALHPLSIQAFNDSLIYFFNPMVSFENKVAMESFLFQLNADVYIYDLRSGKTYHKNPDDEDILRTGGSIQVVSFLADGGITTVMSALEDYEIGMFASHTRFDTVFNITTNFAEMPSAYKRGGLGFVGPSERHTRGVDQIHHNATNGGAFGLAHNYTIIQGNYDYFSDMIVFSVDDNGELEWSRSFKREIVGLEAANAEASMYVADGQLHLIFLDHEDNEEYWTGNRMGSVEALNDTRDALLYHLVLDAAGDIVKVEVLARPEERLYLPWLKNAFISEEESALYFVSTVNRECRLDKVGF